jgi:hypothetical protein
LSSKNRLSCRFNGPFFAVQKMFCSVLSPKVLEAFETERLY